MGGRVPGDLNSHGVQPMRNHGRAWVPAPAGASAPAAGHGRGPPGRARPAGHPPHLVAFSNTTSNSANTAAAGTVTLTDNDAGSALFTGLANLVPGDSDSGCLQVTYSGTLPALVRLHQATTGTLGAALDLVITRGVITSGAFDDCAGFVADPTDYTGLGPGVVYAGTLANLGTTWASGLVDPRTASLPEAWTTGEVHAYRLKLTVRDDNSAQTSSIATTFTFEAQHAPLYAQVILSDSPASYWKLDESAGTSAADAAGTATGTYTNGPLLNQPSGVKHAGTAVTFDGTDDYVTVSDVHDFAGTAPFSVEVWVNPTAPTSQYRRIITKEDTNQYGWRLVLAATTGSPPNRASFIRQDAAGNESAASPSALQTGAWSHVVGTYDGTTMRLYVNGVQVDTKTSSRSIPNHASALSMGIKDGGGAYLGGMLDEVAVYNSVLTAQQVTDHYNAGRR
jgi:hypothetical protein